VAKFNRIQHVVLYSVSTTSTAIEEGIGPTVLAGLVRQKLERSRNKQKHVDCISQHDTGVGRGGI
jgi:hypothetical protein